MVALAVLKNCEIAVLSLEEEIQGLKLDLLNEQKRARGMSMDSEASRGILERMNIAIRELNNINDNY